MNALHPQAEGRTKNDVDAVRHIYLDFDHGGLDDCRVDASRARYAKNKYPNSNLAR